jgi:hypothetical protein
VTPTHAPTLIDSFGAHASGEKKVRIIAKKTPDAS